jgi:hypothetical protein
MKLLVHPHLSLVLCLFLLLAGCSSEEEAAPVNRGTVQSGNRTLVFGGGPAGGTFNFFAHKMATVIGSDQDSISITAVGSGGSLDNLCNLDDQTVDMAIVYGGDAFLGRKSQLPFLDCSFNNVRALAFLYGAPAQLVVRKNSGIASFRDLVGKRVAVGNPGSGAAQSAKRFFEHLGLWDKMEILNQGYSEASASFQAGKIDAFWTLVGYPNASIVDASNVGILLLDLHQEASASGFYEVYPFYSRVDIPAGTYAGQGKPVSTFQDIAVWCANADVDEEVIYNSLCSIYCKENLESMRLSHKAASNMTVEGGVRGVSIPLHPGAATFWDERGVQVPPSLHP